MGLSNFSKHLSHFRLVVIDKIVILSDKVAILLVNILKIVIEGNSFLAKLNVKLSNDRSSTYTVFISNQVPNTMTNCLFVRKESFIALFIKLNSFISNPFESSQYFFKMEAFNFSHFLDEFRRHS